MNPLFYRDFRLGVLGGGQLGRMLLEACHRFNVHTAVLDPDPYAPARGAADVFVEGDFADYDTVVAFGQGLHLLTIEIEHVNTAALRTLRKLGVRIHPQPEVLEVVQDKGLQKEFYVSEKLPTAPFVLINTLTELAPKAYPAILKLRRGGYDGHGVLKLNHAAELRSPRLREFFTGPCLLEDFIPVHKEVSVIVARNPQGQVICYPPVEMAFHPEAHLVEFLFAPADLTVRQVQTVQLTAVKCAEALNMVGLLAVEMFLLADGEVLINEIAPRPHNSGHHTLEANVTSQFEQHLRAILGLPLGSTATKLPAVLVNLLGEPGAAGEPIYQGLEQVLCYPGVSLHLYGKRQVRPNRKMGHITVTDPDLMQAKAKAERVKKELKVMAENQI